MIKKLFILIFKDSLVILNDKAGLGYLFAMPVLLVFIMVLIQDSSFKSVSDIDIKLIIQNKDKGLLGKSIVDELKNSGYFRINEANDKNVNIEEQVAKGNYKIGIIINDSTTYKMKKGIKKNANYMFNDTKNKIGIKNKSADIEIFFDPLTRISYKLMIMSMIKEYSVRIENKVMLDEIQKRMPFKKINTSPNNLITYKEKYASVEGVSIIPNSVQHNVPAWTLFAMFFIVMSLATNMIKERDEGGLTRLSFIPFPVSLYIGSKIITYLFIAFLQFVLMMLMGMYILPIFNFPALEIGGKYFSLLLTGFIASLAAIGYALLIGVFAKTYQQSSTFGSISVVIYAAIGGIWVPVIAMPSFMRTISVVSPLNWGIEAFNNILVRNLSFYDCYKEYALLIGFFIICLSISVKYFSFNRSM